MSAPGVWAFAFAIAAVLCLGVLIVAASMATFHRSRRRSPSRVLTMSREAHVEHLGRENTAQWVALTAFVLCFSCAIAFIVTLIVALVTRT